MALAVPLSRFTSRVGGGSAFFVRLREFMTSLWIMSLGALLVGSFVAWRVARRSHGVTEWRSWFLATMVVSLGIWIIVVFRLLDAPFRFGCLVSILAIHVPALLAGAWAIRRERQ